MYPLGFRRKKKNWRIRFGERSAREDDDVCDDDDDEEEEEEEEEEGAEDPSPRVVKERVSFSL